MARQEPQKRDTPAWRVYHRLYNYSIPKLHFYSQEYQDRHGLLVSGDRAHDATMMSEMIPTRGTAAELAQLFEEGVDIQLQDPEDSVKIYTDIKDSLDVWLDALKREHNLPEPPQDLFKLLDRFADGIYKIARRYKRDIKVRPRDQSRFRQLGTGFQRAGFKRPEVPGKPQVERDRSKMAEILEEKAHARRDEWKG